MKIKIMKEAPDIWDAVFASSLAGLAVDESRMNKDLTPHFVRASNIADAAVRFLDERQNEAARRRMEDGG